jgi:hypothetical protein
MLKNDDGRIGIPKEEEGKKSLRGELENEIFILQVDEAISTASKRWDCFVGPTQEIAVDPPRNDIRWEYPPHQKMRLLRRADGSDRRRPSSQ